MLMSLLIFISFNSTRIAMNSIETESEFCKLSATQTDSCRSNCLNHDSLKRTSPFDDDESPDKIMSNKRSCQQSTPFDQYPLIDYGYDVKPSINKLLKHASNENGHACLENISHDYLQQLLMRTCKYPCENNDTADCNEIQETLDITSEAISCLQDDSVQIHQQLVQLTATIIEQNRKMEILQNCVEEASQIRCAADVNSRVLQSEVDSIKQNFSELVTASSNDGSFIWKITNVSEKIADAIADRKNSIYSAPFYSSPTGYKMCLRLYLNGDGQTRRSHVSLFFVVMRGDYDAILTWPFSYRVTFCLYDQSGNKRHIIDSFQPDTKSSSFERPRSAMNIAAGIPKFVPVSLIHQQDSSYVRNDCMFIQCLIDFDSLPKECMPFVVQLNPGLPSSVRQKAIDSEVEKHRAKRVVMDRPLQLFTTMANEPVVQK